MDALRYVNDLTPSQIRQTQKDSHALWGAGLPLEERIRRLEDLLVMAGKRRFGLSGLSNDHGYVPASMKRYDLVTNIAGKPKKTLGVGAVFTSEASRGLGLGKQLLDWVLAQATKDGYEVALLFSDISPRYYERLGFVELPAWRFYFDVASLPKDRPLEVRPAVATDVPKLLNWYETSWPANFTRPVRDEFRWNFFRKRIGSPTDLVLSDGTKDLGYLTLSEGKAGSLWIDEFVAGNEHLDRVWATIVKLAREKKVDQVRGFLPSFLLPDQVSETERREKAIPMLKALVPGALDGLNAERTHFNGPDLY